MTVLIISDVHGNLLPPQSVFCARTGILNPIALLSQRTVIQPLLMQCDKTARSFCGGAACDIDGATKAFGKASVECSDTAALAHVSRNGGDLPGQSRLATARG